MPYKLLKNLLAPVAPKDKIYEELVAVLKKQYNPKPSEIVQRYKFHTRVRCKGGSSCRLCHRVEHFFGDTLEAMLRDRLVCGINEEGTQKRLLSETKLTYERALEIAKDQETAADSLVTISKEEEEHKPIHKLHNWAEVGDNKGDTGQGQNTEANKECYRCGKPGHTAPACRFNDEKVS